MLKKIGLATALALVGAVAIAKQPPPIIQELGPVVPTPVPSPEAEKRIRLIASFTLQNKPEGASIITFEATDFGKARIEGSKENKYRILATEQYSLVEPKKAARATRDEIMRKIRDLERDLLEFVEIVGPPREREPVTSSGQGGQLPSR